jgi:hypothetical protein
VELRYNKTLVVTALLLPPFTTVPLLEKNTDSEQKRLLNKDNDLALIVYFLALSIIPTFIKLVPGNTETEES